MPHTISPPKHSNLPQTGAIDDVHRATGDVNGEEKRSEGKRIVEGLAKLKYELQHDRQISQVCQDPDEINSDSNTDPLRMMASPT